MSKSQHYTRQRQGIINRYYEHKDSQTAQKLQEFVSESWDNDKERANWPNAGAMLNRAGATRGRLG